MAKKVLKHGCKDRGRTYDTNTTRTTRDGNYERGWMMKKRTLEEDVESALENMFDGGGTVAEHAAVLARDHNLSFNGAVEILNIALKQEGEDAALDDRPWGEQQGQIDFLERDTYPSEPMGDDFDE